MSSFSGVLIALCAWSALLLWTPFSASNILAAQSIAGKSHWNVMRAVLRALTDHGHTVIVFTLFLDGDRPGYTEVDISKKVLMFLAMDAKFLIEKFSSIRKTIPSMVNFTRISCDMIDNDQRWTSWIGRRVGNSTQSSPNRWCPSAWRTRPLCSVCLWCKWLPQRDILCTG